MEKTVLITGATGTLGEILVKRFLEKGYRVIAMARDEKKLDVLSGSNSPLQNLVTLSADVTDEKDILDKINYIKEKFNTVSIFVHAVGGFSGGHLIAETSAQEWDKMITLNLTSLFLCSRAIFPMMMAAKSGKIITITAMAALAPKAKRAAYQVSKAGVISLTKALAEEGKKYNIQANTIAPGIILSEKNKKEMPDADDTKWTRPEQIADMILFLASPAANDITGSIIEMPGKI